MATAYQLTTTSTPVVAAGNLFRTVDIQNLGTEDIWVDRTGSATTTASMRVAPGQLYSFTLPPATTVNARAASTTQVSPADTRVEVLEAS